MAMVKRSVWLVLDNAGHAVDMLQDRSNAQSRADVYNAREDAGELQPSGVKCGPYSAHELTYSVLMDGRGRR